MYKNFLKRILDLIISVPVFILFIPILLILAILIKLESKGPVFFLQERVGQNLSRFDVYKLRTMTHEKREVGNKPIIGKAPGVTRIGHFLRRYKIDELPQVLNVLKGEMSIVGPRPSVPKQLEQMSEEEKKRYSIKPGLTGLAQVSGNIHLSWKERYAYDLTYLRRVSFLRDVKIILKTFLIIFRGEKKYLHSSKELIKKK